MKFTLSWLKDHLDTSASVTEIADTLTMIGLEVESVADRAAQLAPFTAAKIIEAKPHPNASKLQVCRVQSDAGELQIVCGAANARPGLMVALAKEGAVIPHGGMVIKRTKIRDVESCGMLCSAEELNLADKSEGIIELPADARIGQPVAEVLGLNDPVIDIAITPNRADALGVRGIARDLAAAGLGTLKDSGFGIQDSGSKNISSPNPESRILNPISVTITTPHCRQFIGCHISGVKNGESPAWMQQRLTAIGQKPISALVDITNYFTFDLGRPLHVYDAKKLRGNLTVRDSRDGEKIKALDDKEYILPGGICVIADESGPQAIGGIIGGETTGCSSDTTDVFLEVALFNPAHVAENGRTLSIESDARYRFERGIDVAFAETGAKLAVAIIRKLCGGEASNLVHAGKTPQWQREISFSPERIKTLGGVDVSAAEYTRILTALGFSGDSKITPPSWRADVEGEADLIEEILRIHGYDHIPPTPLPISHTTIALPLNRQRARMAKRALAGRGMLEVCTWSFLPEKSAKIFGGGAPALKLQNPISEDLSDMRPSLVPNLLEAAKKNAARGFKAVQLCEVGLQFHDTSPTGQKLIAAGIRTGNNTHFTHAQGIMKQETASVDTFAAKADALAVLQALGIGNCDISTDTPPWYHPGRSGKLSLGGKILLGYFGEVHPAIAQQFDIESRVAAFEIFLENIPAARAKGTARPMLKLSDFQAVERDFAFIVDDAVSAAHIIKTLRQADKTLIAGIELFDVYSGKGIEPGKKSVAVRITLQSFERTLSEADITAASNAIVTAAKSFGGQLRQ